MTFASLPSKLEISEKFKIPLLVQFNLPKKKIPFFKSQADPGTGLASPAAL